MAGNIEIPSAKFSVTFKAGQLPRVGPNNPVFVLRLGSFAIHAKINQKAARKLAVHAGGAALQGKLTCEGNQLVLADAGFQWFDEPKPTPASSLTAPPRGTSLEAKSLPARQPAS